MAIVTTLTTMSIDTSTAQFAPQVADLKAGEALTKGAIVYIKSDGLVWLANGTAATAPADAKGIVASDAAVGEAATIFSGGVRMGGYAAGMTLGATLYVGATAGKLDTAATTGDATGFAFAVTATDIIIGAAKL